MRLTATVFLFWAFISYSAETVDYGVSFDVAAQGATVTVSNLLKCTTGPTNANSWTVSGTMTYDSVGQKALLGPVTVRNYGSFDGSGSLGLKMPLTAGNTLTFTPTNISANGGTSMSIGVWWQTDDNDVGANEDTLMIHNSNLDAQSCYVNMTYHNHSFTAEIKLNNGSSPAGSMGSITSGNWYWLTQGFNCGTSNYQFSVYDANTNLVGTFGITNSYQPFAPLFAAPFANVTYAGLNAYYDSMIVDSTTAVFPLMPGSAPPSGTVYYVRTDGNNSNTGTENTSGGAYLTIGKAASVAVAGDIVRVQSGTYNERVADSSSGSSSAWINFVCDGQVICRGFDLTGVSYVRLTGFEITHINLTYQHGITFSGTSSHVDLIDNYIHDIYGAGVHPYGGSVSSYLTMRGNTFYWMNHIAGSIDNGSTTAIDSIPITTHHILEEYNIVQRGADGFVITYGTNAVIRNNYLWDFKDSYFTNAPNTIHSDIFQDGSDSSQVNTVNHVYENNFSGDCIESNSHWGLWQDSFGADTNLLIRGNVGYHFGSGCVGNKNTSKISSYNNSFYDATVAFVYYNSGGTIQGGMVQNNIMSSMSSGGMDIETFAVFCAKNLGFNSGSHTSFVSTADCKFVDPTTPVRNFHLQSSSPARGLATNVLWVTSSANSGYSFTVNDPQLIIDGWGMVDGDTITVGTNAPTVVTNINWGTSTVSVNSSVTWTNLMPVYWMTNSANDLGALPYGSSDLTSAVMLSSGTTFTVTPTGSTRGVWFYTNGIPALWVSSSPFQATIASTTNVTAKAYALYAQANPVVSASLQLPISAFIGSGTLRVGSGTLRFGQ